MPDPEVVVVVDDDDDVVVVVDDDVEVVVVVGVVVVHAASKLTDRRPTRVQRAEAFAFPTVDPPSSIEWGGEDLNLRPTDYCCGTRHQAPAAA